MASVLITFNEDDGTISVRAGRQVEHIGIEYKSKSEIFDAVKYACITMGVSLSNIELTETLQRIGV